MLESLGVREDQADWSLTPWPAGSVTPPAPWSTPTAAPSQYTSWLFGTRMREAGLMGSMGKVACAYDKSLMESFFGSMQIELLDRRTCRTRAQLTAAIFEWIEAWCNPTRRHSARAYHSPIEFEALHTAAPSAA